MYKHMYTCIYTHISRDIGLLQRDIVDPKIGYRYLYIHKYIYIHAGINNPTVRELEETLTCLENGNHTICTCSGMCTRVAVRCRAS